MLLPPVCNPFHDLFTQPVPIRLQFAACHAASFCLLLFPSYPCSRNFEPHPLHETKERIQTSEYEDRFIPALLHTSQIWDEIRKQVKSRGLCGGSSLHFLRKAPGYSRLHPRTRPTQHT